ncbi:MAG: tRNA (mo5U34)-methyltransferase [Blastocatellia bacterium]|jgi:tRNA (mo5U34)-methyltransferase|nr:tRNA (mo5U34)-methyltransferase [Blastocatellia bacterium]
MTFTKEELQEMAGKVPFWFHSIDLGQGVVTKGWKTPDHLTAEVESLRLPDLRGKSVLDINALDGFYSFEAARRGARRVVALDHYMWAMDLGEHSRYWLECKERGITPAPYHTMPYYKPDELPGKIGFDTAHRALGSKVEDVVADFMDMDLEPLGTFDVVFYLGSLYHMENPLLAMQRVAAVTTEVAVIETEAAAFPNFEQHALCEFFETNELNGDVSNWWAPNEKALVGLCRAAGFKRVDVLVGDAHHTRSLPQKMRSAAGSALRELSLRKEGSQVKRYRAIAHAWK